MVISLSLDAGAIRQISGTAPQRLIRKCCSLRTEASVKSRMKESEKAV
jgi:hypothetical protein